MSIQAKLMYLFIKAMHGNSIFETIEGAREMMNKNAIINELPLTIPKVKSKITEKTCKGLSTYWFTNDGNAKDSIILYIHGGAFVNQPSPLHWRYVDKIARSTGTPLVMAVYPKAPVHQFTEAYDFLMAVYSEMLDFGYTNIIFMGDSAGATLSIGLAMWLKEQNKPMPSKLVLLSPCVDMTLENSEILYVKQHDPMLAVPGILEIGKEWSGGADLCDYRLSPIYGDLSELPPTLLLIGSYEILCPDARKFKELADRAGAPLSYREYPKMFHVFPGFPIPEADKANKEIFEFIGKTT